MWKSLTSLYCVLLFLMGGILLFSPIVTATAAPQPERDALSTRSKLSQILNNEKKKLLSFSSPQRNLCPYFSIPNIFNYMEKNSQNTNLDHVLRDAMITTPCFDSDSFGNTLSNYIEMRICSNITGYHFIGVSPEKGLASGSQSKPSLNPFSTLPEIVYNGDAGRKKSISEVMSICQCTSICHEHENALLHHHAQMVRDILRPVFDFHYRSNMLEQKNEIEKVIATKNWKSIVRSPGESPTTQAESVLPMIPDVAVHYRCGDNTVGHYGYLSYPAFKRRIPSTARTIYVMAENPSRNSNTQRNNQCNAILTGLFDYLKAEFSQASIVILRGANMFDDMTRLALANTTICSVSSFCIWPALSSTTKAYFPITRLIAKATAPLYDVGKTFEWLNYFPDEVVLPGVKSKRMDNSHIVKFLNNPKGFRPLPPQYVLDKQRGRNSKRGQSP